MSSFPAETPALVGSLEASYTQKGPPSVGCGLVYAPAGHVVTRKTDSTDPKFRWRDAPVATAGRSLKAPAGDLPPVEAPPAIAGISEVTDQVAPEIRELDADGEQNSSQRERTLMGQLAAPRMSSWLTSTALHLILLIILALLTYRINGGQQGILIDGAVSESGSTTNLTIESVSPDQSVDHQMEDEDQQVPVDVAVTAMPINPPSQQKPATTPLDQAIAELKSGGAANPTSAEIFMGGGGMSARNPEGRKKYGDRYGATAESEAAVEKALSWLAQHQRHDGSWSFDLTLAPCEGRCRHSRKRGDETPTPATAATGLALLAFLGAGHTSHVGPYQETVSKGLYYLRAVASETEYGFDWQQGGSMYGHGIALMAVSEALGMTKRDDRYDSDLWHYADRGTQFTVTAQHPNGSWGYTPGSPGDTTLTGWQILSLIGAKKAGVQTRSYTLARAKKFLMSVRSEPDYQFGYKSRKAEPTTTAIALTLLMYLGQRPGYTFFDRAVDQLAEAGPSKTNVYHNYYATMALHHWRHRDWESWNTTLRDHLVRTQSAKGHEAGSWHFPDEYGDIGGRVYTTAMCALTLEVYYRFLPLYDEPPEFPL